MYLQDTSPASHKTALIKLIPKSGALSDIKNWRPIALLNLDYKILAKIIALRLTPLLECYLEETQQAAIKGRSLHNILLSIKAAADYSTNTGHPLALLQLDFSKAFDRLSHDFLFSVMEHIRIPHEIIKWTSILLRGSNARILVNHDLTKPVPITTGIKQGCPLSMLLFTLATDVLAKKLLALPQPDCLSLGSSSLKLQQYADDTILALADTKDVGTSLKAVEDFSSHSNLQINPRKTVILSNNEPLRKELQRYLPNSKFTKEAKILGITFSLTDSYAKKNWTKTLATIKHITEQHRNRNLTMFGKLSIIKTIILPHITFTSRIFTCPRATQKQISAILHKFLWYPQKLEPIARTTLSKSKQHGGIGMPSVDAWILLPSLSNSNFFYKTQAQTNFRRGTGFTILDTKSDHSTPNFTKRTNSQDPPQMQIGPTSYTCSKNLT